MLCEWSTLSTRYLLCTIFRLHVLITDFTCSFQIIIDHHDSAHFGLVRASETAAPPT